MCLYSSSAQVVVCNEEPQDRRGWPGSAAVEAVSCMHVVLARVFLFLSFFLYCRERVILARYAVSHNVKMWIELVYRLDNDVSSDAQCGQRNNGTVSNTRELRCPLSK